MTKDEFIKKYIKRYKKGSYWCKDIEAVVAIMPDDVFGARITEHTLKVDNEKLFTNVEDSIKYLQTIDKKYTLVERWDGYESNYFIFVCNEKETEEETFKRLDDEYYRYRKEYYERLKEVEKKKLRKAELLKELKELDEENNY